MQALRPLLRQLFAADPDISQHQQAVAETQFTKQFQPPPQAQPLSETPLLITRVELTNVCSASGASGGC